MVKCDVPYCVIYTRFVAFMFVLLYVGFSITTSFWWSGGGGGDKSHLSASDDGESRTFSCLHLAISLRY